jgi:aminoglycoside 6'-N-acetyltransferase
VSRQGREPTRVPRHHVWVDDRLTFRRVTDADLPLLHRWLNDPGVVRWWEGDDVSEDAVAADYGSTSDPAFEHWLAVDGHGTPLGWAQCYAVTDSPEEAQQWWAHGVHRTAAGIDYLVGDPGARGRGVGTAMLATFLDEVVWPLHPGWTQVCAAPYEANTASWRVLERVGFRHVATLPDDEGPCRLMVRERGQPTS